MSQTCSEPLVWTCKACGHSFHEKEWAKADRKCPACQRGAGNWKCTLCQETFNQPALSAIHPCRRNSSSNAFPEPVIGKGTKKTNTKERSPVSTKTKVLCAFGVALLLGFVASLFHRTDSPKDPVPMTSLNLMTSLIESVTPGDALAQRFVKLNRTNDFVLQDWTNSAEQGNVTYQFILGLWYYNGDGVAEDKKEAVRWWTKSAKQELAEAQCNLGFVYENTLAVPQSRKEAVKWYTKSAQQGHPTAQLNLGICYFKGDGVAEDKKEAVKWWAKSAEQGDATAQLNLGTCYGNGNGVTQDYKEAVKWYKKAADQGIAEAREWIRKNNL